MRRKRHQGLGLATDEHRTEYRRLLGIAKQYSEEASETVRAIPERGHERPGRCRQAFLSLNVVNEYFAKAAVHAASVGEKEEGEVLRASQGTLKVENRFMAKCLR